MKHFALFLFAASCCAAGPLSFRERVVATDLDGGYQVVAADLNRDGKPDLIALASGMTDLVWFENPGWQRHVIASGLYGMINLAAWDIDGDGIPEIVVAHGFSMNIQKSAGILSLLHHNGDPRQPWTVHEIARMAGSHRLRVANGVLIDAPLAGPNAVAPDYRDHVPLVYFTPDDWKQHLIDNDNEGILHGLTIVDWDHGGRDSILTAGFSGIHLRRLMNGKWVRTEISPGDPDPWPKCGASDVALGHLHGKPFITTIEPWHGNQVAVYTQSKNGWQRDVIDSSLLDAHNINTADFDGDGNDEIVAGFRGAPHSVYLYRFENGHWARRILDNGGIAAAGCAIADLNGDGRPDVTCIGSSTHNLKWYENTGN